MNGKAEQIKTFAQAHDRLKEMAAGRNYTVQVDMSNYAGLRLNLYIEDIGWTSGDSTWTAAFADMETKIRALDSDCDPLESAAGIDDAIADANKACDEVAA